MEQEMLRLIEEAINQYRECGEDFPEGLSDYGAVYNEDFPHEVTVTVDGEPKWRLKLVDA